SIAVNGVCLTVTKFSNNFFEAEVMSETFKLTTISSLKADDYVNLERALKAGDRLGGHFVSGHIDGQGKIKNINKIPGKYIFEIQSDKDILDYIVKKGSIAVDGISLTVIDVTNSYFSFSVIPHTLEQTTLQEKKIGDIVNLETDIVGKYILKKSDKKDISLDFLKEHGF
ncbi:riboflavin synthase, partial [bacterium]|nr:riboflavin synthase [bacterium]